MMEMMKIAMVVNRCTQNLKNKGYETNDGSFAQFTTFNLGNY